MKCIKKTFNSKLFLLQFILVLILIGLILYTNNSYHKFKLSTSNYKICELNQNNKTVKYILLWTEFFYPLQFNKTSNGLFYIGNDYFKEINCPNINCVITPNSSYLDKVTDFDAILFHGRYTQTIFNSTPKIRSPNQKYIIALLEPPTKTSRLLKLDKDFFNWTMTYRLDSDIIWSYGNIQDKITGEIVSPSYNPKWRPVDEYFYDKYYLEIAGNKTKMAAWMVSNCWTVYSKRQELTHSLQKHNVSIDIFGKCGTLKCFDRVKCRPVLNNYKFYLAFENSLCLDYVTEKLFDNFNLDIILIVFGGADYDKFLPPFSYINANDFKTIRELAEYLIFLNENDNEYIKYFWWKKYYKAIRKETETFCKLCEMLNTAKLENTIEFYRDIEAWWNVCVMEPDITLD